MIRINKLLICFALFNQTVSAFLKAVSKVQQSTEIPPFLKLTCKNLGSSTITNIISGLAHSGSAKIINDCLDCIDMCELPLKIRGKVNGLNGLRSMLPNDKEYFTQFEQSLQSLAETKDMIIEVLKPIYCLISKTNLKKTKESKELEKLPVYLVTFRRKEDGYGFTEIMTKLNVSNYFKSEEEELLFYDTEIILPIRNIEIGKRNRIPILTIQLSNICPLHITFKEAQKESAGARAEEEPGEEEWDEENSDEEEWESEIPDIRETWLVSKNFLPDYLKDPTKWDDTPYELEWHTDKTFGDFNLFGDEFSDSHYDSEELGSESERSEESSSEILLRSEDDFLSLHDSEDDFLSLHYNSEELDSESE